MVQRRVPRIPVDWAVTVHLDDVSRHGRMLNFSENGMLATPSEVAEVGKCYDISFSVPGFRAPFKVRGTALYRNAKGTGFRFERVPVDLIFFFHEYVKMSS